MMENTGIKSLALAVIGQAVKDIRKLKSTHIDHKEARSFLFEEGTEGWSESLETWCGRAGIDVNYFRRKRHLLVNDNGNP
jgi:hypothetical protein